jgi:hypothetical protein
MLLLRCVTPNSEELEAAKLSLRRELASAAWPSTADITTQPMALPAKPDALIACDDGPSGG